MRYGTVPSWIPINSFWFSLVETSILWSSRDVNSRSSICVWGLVGTMVDRNHNMKGNTVNGKNCLFFFGFEKSFLIVEGLSRRTMRKALILVCVVATVLCVKTQGEECVACPAGTYGNASLPECAGCKPGSCTPDGCGGCPAGTWSGKEASTCTECAPGKYSDIENATECTPCAPGTAQNLTGASKCGTCRDGTIAAHEGATVCDICETGTSNKGDNHTECVKCERGYEQPETNGAACRACKQGTFTNKTGTVECEPCHAGMYQAGTGQESCSACASGTYASSEGSSKCTICPAGHYCDSGGTVTPTLCPENKRCPAGSANPIECGALHKSGPGSANCSPTWALYLVVTLAAVAGAVICILGVVAVCKGSRGYRRGSRDEKEEGTSAPLVPQKTTAGARIVVYGKVRNADYGDACEGTSVIPDDDDGPVYSGL